jgi:hypothetical protein
MLLSSALAAAHRLTVELSSESPHRLGRRPNNREASHGEGCMYSKLRGCLKQDRIDAQASQMPMPPRCDIRLIRNIRVDEKYIFFLDVPRLR